MGNCTSNNDVLSFMAAAKAIDMFACIKKGRITFTEIMFETELNPGILNRLLKMGVGLKLIEKNDGYTLTEKGQQAFDLAVKIKALN